MAENAGNTKMAENTCLNKLHNYERNYLYSMYLKQPNVPI